MHKAVLRNRIHDCSSHVIVVPVVTELIPEHVPAWTQHCDGVRAVASDCFVVVSSVDVDQIDFSEVGREVECPRVSVELGDLVFNVCPPVLAAGSTLGDDRCVRRVRLALGIATIVRGKIERVHLCFVRCVQRKIEGGSASERPDLEDPHRLDRLGEEGQAGELLERCGDDFGRNVLDLCANAASLRKHIEEGFARPRPPLSKGQIRSVDFTRVDGGRCPVP